MNPIRAAVERPYTVAVAVLLRVFYVLALQDQTVGLLTEILLAGRSRGELRREVDPIQAARVVIHATTGARLAWANGQIGPEECRNTLDGARQQDDANAEILAERHAALLAAMKNIERELRSRQGETPPTASASARAEPSPSQRAVVEAYYRNLSERASP